MVFSSIPFLYYFLPITLLVYFLVPKKLKNLVLLVFSLTFYAWGEPRYVLLMAVTIVAFYLCGLGIGKSEGAGRKKCFLILSAAIGVSFLAVFKYADFFIDSFNSVTGISLPLLRLALPVGISFYTFQCLSYTIDVYRDPTLMQKNLISFGAYVVLFPQLIAGPIVRYVDVARELQSRTHSWHEAALGLRRFLVGLAKKVILADNFALLVQMFRTDAAPSVLFHWLYAVSFMLNIYFDFSGYSDMAIGLGRIFGFHFIENFNYPYLSGSITEFWRRWHISLGSWFRDYIYIPLGGNRVSTLRWIRNILLVWMLTGLWHGAAWNFVLWGLLFAAMLLLEKYIPRLKNLPAGIKNVYVLFIVMVSFVLFNAESFSQAGSDLGGLFGLGGIPLLSQSALYYLRSYAPLLLVGFVGATPLMRNLGRRLENTRVGTLLEPLLLLALLLICTAYLVDGSFSPFLYFRF